jgi:hypothetical protein
VDEMEIKEAKLKIATEFITKYREWLSDYNNPDMSDHDFGWKYGWRRSEKAAKDLQKSMLWFHGHIFSGKYLNQWKADGIDLETLKELNRQGFLSYDCCTSNRARMLGKVDFWYINQNTAKAIYKEYK